MSVSWNFEAIGTHWVIDLYQELDAADEARINQLVRERIELFESTYSRFRKESWLSKLSQGGTFPLPPDATPMLDLYRNLYKSSEGTITPLIGQVLADAGYDAAYSLEPKRVSEPAAFDTAVSFDDDTITVSQPAAFDFGGLGKGYLIDIVAELLEREGVKHYCVDAGGDMRHRNIKPLRVGFEDPEDSSRVIGTLNLGNGSLAGSSGNRRAWNRFNHIINPKTLTSPRHILAVWASAESTLLADAMTTALYFCDPNELLREYRFEYLMLHADRSVTGTMIDSASVELY